MFVLLNTILIFGFMAVVGEQMIKNREIYKISI